MDHVAPANIALVGGSPCSRWIKSGARSVVLSQRLDAGGAAAKEGKQQKWIDRHVRFWAVSEF
jgi:hypothetical protein